MSIAVIFDLDDTLYDQMLPFTAACHHFPALQNVDPNTLYRLRGIHGMYALRSMSSGSMTLDENHIYRMQMACRDLGILLSNEEALEFQKCYAKEQNALVITPVMKHVLNLCLEKNWTIGLLTNGPSDHQRHKIRTLGLCRWIPDNRIIISGECGILKPDPSIFRLAEALWGLDPKQTWYVGDSLENDIAGANAAGWRSFWLDRKREVPHCPRAVPTRRGSEADLLDFLRSDEITQCL